MSVDLNMTYIVVDPADPNYSGDEYVAMLDDLQGNILKSHGREFSTHLFIEFGSDATAAKQWVANVAARLVTSAQQQREQAAAFRASGADGGVFGNFALTAAGYRALGLTEIPDDPSFVRGMQTPPEPPPPLGLNDPPVSQWEAGFQGPLHAVLMLADDNSAELAAAVATIEPTLAGVGTIVATEQGEVLRNAAGEPIEPFGFADGVSQPLFLSEDIDAARMNGGIDRYDPSAPLGLVLLPDPGSGGAGYGSYFVYRKLAQDVTDFTRQLNELAAKLGVSEELAGAYVFGRFRDGTPVVAQPVPGWTNEPLNFNYDDDADGLRCPFQAHIRKTNPRGDKMREFGLPPTEDRSRRIARRAVPYPPGATSPPAEGTEVGLLFACAQSSIVHQFEFIQAIWSNFTEFLRPGTGLDPVIGQDTPTPSAPPQQWPTAWGERTRQADGTYAPPVEYDFTRWVTLRGGEYFFLPSIGVLKSLA